MELKTKGFTLVKDSEFEAINILIKQLPKLDHCIKAQFSQMAFNNKTPEEQHVALCKFKRVLGEVQETLNLFQNGKEILA